jgi:hypothetical protein
MRLPGAIDTWQAKGVADRLQIVDGLWMDGPLPIWCDVAMTKVEDLSINGDFKQQIIGASRIFEEPISVTQT